MLSIMLFFFSASTAFAENNDFGEADRSVIEGLFEEEESNTEQKPSFQEEEEDAADGAVVNGDQGPSLIGLTAQLVLALGVVLLLIYGLMKFVNKRAKSFSSHQTVQSVGGVGIGTNRSVQLVRVGDRLLVLGVGDSVSLLKEIEDPAEIEAMLQKEEHQDFIKPKAAIESWLSKRKKKENPYAPAEKHHFQSLLTKEMDGVKQSQDKVHHTLEEKDQ